MGANVRDWLAETIAETLDVDLTKVTDAARLGADLGADSLDLLELVMVAEDRYGIDIPDNELPGCVTFADVVALIDRKRGEA